MQTPFPLEKDEIEYCMCNYHSSISLILESEIASCLSITFPTPFSQKCTAT